MVALSKAVWSFSLHLPRAVMNLPMSPVLVSADAAFSSHCENLPDAVSAAAAHFCASVGGVANAVAGSVAASASVSRVRRIIVGPPAAGFQGFAEGRTCLR